MAPRREIERIAKAREKDERILHWLWLRHRGQTISRIATITKAHENTVIRATNLAMQHDLDHPDPRATIAKKKEAYW